MRVGKEGEARRVCRIFRELFCLRGGSFELGRRGWMCMRGRSTEAVEAVGGGAVVDC